MVHKGVLQKSFLSQRVLELLTVGSFNLQESFIWISVRGVEKRSISSVTILMDDDLFGWAVDDESGTESVI